MTLFLFLILIWVSRMFAAGVITDLNLVYGNWPAMARRILIGSLSGPNFAMRTAKMDDPPICFRV